MNKNKYPLVTIGIPTYNRAGGYLKEALASALNQTYANIEIIVSDNCSTDGTAALMRNYTDSRLRYTRHKENIGANNNFNYCLEQATGDYFLLLQDDDLIDEDFVESCMRSADYSTDVGVIRTGTRVIDSNGNVLRESQNRAGGLSTEEFFRAWFACKTSLYLCSTLYNTRWLKDIGGFQSKCNLVQDGVALVQLAARFGRVDVKDVKANFRKHPGEITFAVKVKDWCEDYLELLNLMCEVIDDNVDLVRSEGMRFLCRLNYNRASAIGSSIKRFSTYLMVYRMFDYNYSLMEYLASPRILSTVRQIKKRVRQGLDRIKLHDKS
ncbi:glycosyltransferase [bacterium]|nr:glycosyltransferase [bacterium]